MPSRKRSATRKQREEFEAGFTSLDGLFARAEAAQDRLDSRREAVHRARSCERKMRYDTRTDAEDAIARCKERGTRGLRCYRCEFCGGWHLTSRQG